MNYRKVFLSKGNDEAWPTLYDAATGTVLNCWQQMPVTEEENDPPCHSGCVAFCCPGKEEDSLIMCMALPRDHVGAPAVIGELVDAPEEDDDDDDEDDEE